MKTSKWFIVVFCVIALAACNGKQTKTQEVKTEAKEAVPEYPVTVPFEKGIENEREVLLSQVADKVEYIPLETSDRCLIKWLHRGTIFFNDNCWFVYGNRDLYQFTDKGKLVRKFGSVGQGPGQYNYIQHFDIDPAQKLIYMLTTEYKMNVYSLETGDFLNSIPFKNIESRQFALLKDSTIASFIDNSDGQKKDRIFISNMKGDSLNAFPRYDLFEPDGQGSYMMGGDDDRYMSHYKDLVLLNEVYNDTVYSVTRNELSPRYYIQLGKYSIPLNCRYEYLKGDYNRFKELAAPYVRAFTVESDNYLFIRFSYWAGEKANRSQLVMYDKKDKSCYKVKEDAIRNDLDGGLPLTSPGTVINGNQLLCIWTAGDIFKLAEQNPSILQHEQLKNLKEDDNPVLMVVTLK